MAMINCPECRQAVSSRASSCPHCGCPISAAESPRSPPQVPVVPTRPPAVPTREQGAFISLMNVLTKLFLWGIGAAVTLVVIASVGTYLDNRQEPTRQKRRQEQIASTPQHATDFEQRILAKAPYNSLVEGVKQGSEADEIVLVMKDEWHDLGFQARHDHAAGLLKLWKQIHGSAGRMTLVDKTNTKLGGSSGFNHEQVAIQ